MDDNDQDIIFNNFCWPKVKAGDIILRPIVPREKILYRYCDLFLNRLIPMSLGHAMLYAGNNCVYDIVPDERHIIYEDINTNFSRYTFVGDNPASIVFVRIALDATMKARLFEFLKAHMQTQTKFKAVFRPKNVGIRNGVVMYDGFNCIHGLKLAQLYAGVPHESFNITPNKSFAAKQEKHKTTLMQRFVARYFFTGYNFYWAADQIINPYRIL